MHDIFSPPVTSRIYAYPNIAAYEAMVPSNPGFVSMAGQLEGLSEVPQPQKDREYLYELSSMCAFLTVARELVFSQAEIDAYAKKTYEDLKNKGIPSDIYERSMDYGRAVAQHILAWAAKDNYKQTRTFPKYTVLEQDSAWKPTPPSYMEGIEPHWNKIRPMVIDSSNQFIPKMPTPFDMNKNSDFYKELMEVYEIGKSLNKDQLEIAKFWDCNPFVSHQTGHVMFATKKISPGGHWIGITAIACRQKNLGFMETLEAYARVSISLMDAFISCWDEKWRSIRVRPETLIQEHIDESWAPLLQTPPFPEYTSGHSVISRAAAVTLTGLLGDSFAFKDTTEVEYGLPAREFKSFMEASDEAAKSRLYGGIHYRSACENGVAQGEMVGKFIRQNLRTRKEKNQIQK
ncbi:MAG: vanadium-dependent haloperoxidase [Microscillaceae bacterium]|nr:vanadium-dependent haloperoxidase [Microscillaceae bacterium]